MLLREIVHMQPLQWKWVSDTIATFEMDGVLFAIILEPTQINTGTQIIYAINISFGDVIDMKLPISSKNIDRGLFGHNKPFTVLSTVAAACKDHAAFIKRFNIIVLGASGKKADKRSDVYWTAMTEMEPDFPEHRYHYTAKTPNGSTLQMFSNVDLTPEEQDVLANKYGLEKIQTNEGWSETCC